MDVEKSKSNLRVIIEFGIAIAMPVVLGVSSFMALKVLDHEVRLTAIEHSRYTKDDAKADLEKQHERYDAIFVEISKIRESIARQEARQTR